MPKEEIQSLASRRGLFFPTAEIYSDSPGGFWEFGSTGARLKRKIVNFWRKELVEKENFLEIEGSQILPKPVFESSGHLKNFNDPIVQCKKCHSFYRVDRMLEELTGKHFAENASIEEFEKELKKLNPECKKCKSHSWNKIKLFNMMMSVELGATGDKKAFLRPETCQNIFLNFSRIYKNSRQNLPLGIAQAGSSFRNEINPRNTLLRERELGQMEIEIFFNSKKINEFPDFEKIKNYKLNLMTLKNKKIKPVTCKEAADKKIVSGKLIAYYLALVQKFYEKLGIPLKKMRFRELDDNDKAFYSIETWDFEIETDLGWIELIANNYRADYDLKAHSKGSKQDLSIKEDGEKFVPHVWEISAGIDRTFYVVLDNAFKKEKRGKEERIFLNLPISIAPYLAGVFPLVKKDGLLEKSKQLFRELEKHGFELIFDEKGSIGRRYARIDEIGVPFAITFDYDSVKNNTVTLRERNSLEQKLVKIEQLSQTLWKLSNGILTFNELK